MSEDYWIAFAYLFFGSILSIFKEKRDVHKRVCITVTRYLENPGRVCLGILFQEAQLMSAWAGHHVSGSVVEGHLHFMTDRK